MAEPSRKRRLLFLHANNGKPSSCRTHNKALDSKLRRHVMVDIGRSRRKPAKELPFATLVWQPSSRLAVELENRDDAKIQTPMKHLVGADTAPPYTSRYAPQPLIHTLSAFEKEWGEDSFSAYGFTLLLISGENALISPSSANALSIPFAFQSSPFLTHHQSIFSSPHILIPLYLTSASTLRFLALQRSLATIRCVESRLASPDLSHATSDAVISAVLAMICYNFASGDLEQAMVHVRGLGRVVEVRGGICNLKEKELREMVSWVNRTAALMCDSEPIFARSAGMSSTESPHGLR